MINPFFLLHNLDKIKENYKKGDLVMYTDHLFIGLYLFALKSFNLANRDIKKETV